MVQKINEENFAIITVLDVNVFKIYKDVVICASASTVVTHMVASRRLQKLGRKEKGKVS